MYFTAFFVVQAVLEMAGSLLVYYITGLAFPKMYSPVFLLWCLVVPVIYAVGNINIRRLPHSVVRLFAWIGGVWMGFVLYTGILSIALPVLALIGHFLGIPHLATDFVPLVLFLGALLTLIGVQQSQFPELITVHLTTDKPLEAPLRILFIADIHLGALLGRTFAKRMLRMAQKARPDIILIGGDIIDRDFSYPYKEGSLALLGRLKAPLGVYAVYGNHDLAADARLPEKAYFHELGIPFLVNQTVFIRDFMLTGLDDYIFGDKNYELPAAGDKYSILLEHEPENIPAIADHGYDLCLSGHTHGGQLWPFNWMNDSLFYQNKGVRRVGNLVSIVSRGFGGTSIPVRLGVRADMVLIEVRSTREKK